MHGQSQARRWRRNSAPFQMAACLALPPARSTPLTSIRVEWLRRSHFFLKIKEIGTANGYVVASTCFIAHCLYTPGRIYSRTTAMVVTKNHSIEKAEVEHVLASGIFDRSPGLAQLLTYVCNKYFEGRASEVKEYNIAIEALGRP